MAATVGVTGGSGGDGGDGGTIDLRAVETLTGAAAGRILATGGAAGARVTSGSGGPGGRGGSPNRATGQSGQTGVIGTAALADDRVAAVTGWCRALTLDLRARGATAASLQWRAGDQNHRADLLATSG